MDTNKPTNDHDLLIEVNTNVKNLTSTLNSYTQAANTTMNDHETRIRVLETDNQQLRGSQKNQRLMLSILSAVVGVGGIVLAVIQLIVSGGK